MVQLKYDYLLPIGSVVKVKGVERKLMIYGILQRSPEAPDKIFDYVGAPYPEGFQDVRLNIVFNHTEVEEILCRGYEDGERKAFLYLIEASMWKREQDKKSGKE